MKRSKIMVAAVSLCSLASALYAEANTIKLNFKQAPLDVVLTHMSKSLGLSVVKKAEVNERITVMSEKELSQDEALVLLNAILIEKGYAAIISGDILKVVTKQEAKKYNTPVSAIKDPALLPEGDLIVTQIMKLNYVTSKDLVSTIKPLITDSTVLSSNESGNAIVITDTQTNIKRFAKIIAALDRSATAAADIRVYRLDNAQASDIATMITKIFNSNNSNKKNSTNQGGGGGRFARMMQMMGRRGGGGANGNKSSKETVSFNITAVADKSTNAVVVSAPEDMMPIIDRLITDVDIPATTILQVEVFPLVHAEASEVASTLTSLFSSQSSGSSRNNNNRNNQNFRFGRNNRNNNNNNNKNKKSGSDTDEFKAVADARSNSVIISSSESLLPQVKKVILQLDNKPTNVTQVYIYDIKHADIEQLQETLEEMFGNISSTSSSGSSRSSSRNTSNNQNSRNNNRR